MHWRYSLFLDDGYFCDKLRWFTFRFVIARVYGLTNEVQKRYMTKCIGVTVYFLMTVAVATFGVWFTFRFVIARIYSFTREVQRRYLTDCFDVFCL